MITPILQMSKMKTEDAKLNPKLQSKELGFKSRGSRVLEAGFLGAPVITLNSVRGPGDATV